MNDDEACFLDLRGHRIVRCLEMIHANHWRADGTKISQGMAITFINPLRNCFSTQKKEKHH